MRATKFARHFIIIGGGLGFLPAAAFFLINFERVAYGIGRRPDFVAFFGLSFGFFPKLRVRRLIFTCDAHKNLYRKDFTGNFC